MCEYRLPFTANITPLYRRHIDCAFGVNIDLHKYPLIHRRRDNGPPFPQRLLRNRGKVGVGVVSRRGATIYMLLYKVRQSQAEKVGVLYIFLIFNYPNGGEWCSLTQPLTEIGAY